MARAAHTIADKIIKAALRTNQQPTAIIEAIRIALTGTVHACVLQECLGELRRRSYKPPKGPTGRTVDGQRMFHVKQSRNRLQRAARKGASRKRSAAGKVAKRIEHRGVQ